MAIVNDLEQAEVATFDFRLGVQPADVLVDQYADFLVASGLIDLLDHIGSVSDYVVGVEVGLAQLAQEVVGATEEDRMPGVGGCGKTRLAIQVAREMADEFADGAWCVELAAAREDERVLQLVVKAVGLVESQQFA